jgi:tetratricopeptide (TPR) repeat protein
MAKINKKRNQKKSDETLVDLVEVGSQAQSFYDRNQNIIFGALVGLVVIIGGVFAYNNFYKKPRQAEATEQMFQAQLQFERDSFIMALTNPGGGYYGFLDIIDNYGGTKAGNLANYYAGISYLNLGKYEAAIDYLKAFNAKGEVTPIMKFGALGDAYTELGDMERGLSFYKKASAQNGNDELTAYYMMKVGMLYEKMGDLNNARKTYEKLKSDYPNTTDGRNAEKYLIRVNAKG